MQISSTGRERNIYEILHTCNIVYIYCIYIYNITSSESIFISVIFGFSVSAPLKGSMNVQRLASAGSLTVISVWSISLLTGNHSVKIS